MTVLRQEVMRLPAIQKPLKLPLLCAVVHSKSSLELCENLTCIYESSLHTGMKTFAAKDKIEARGTSEQNHYCHLLVELQLKLSYNS